MLCNYALEELKNDNRIVLEDVKQKGYALKYTSEDLQNNFFSMKEIK